VIQVWRSVLGVVNRSTSASQTASGGGMMNFDTPDQTT
jgi:hypothetical protein